MCSFRDTEAVCVTNKGPAVVPVESDQYVKENKGTLTSFQFDYAHKTESSQARWRYVEVMLKDIRIMVDTGGVCV